VQVSVDQFQDPPAVSGQTLQNPEIST